MRTMHLFAGGGGGMYADLILGHTPVVAVEWDKHACKVLRARKEDGWWPDCEIIEGDVRGVDGSRYAGKVDIVAAGFPCQDNSIANRTRTGLEGARSGLYKEAIRIYCESGAKFLWLENVTGILSGDIGRLMHDLAEVGLDARWGCLAAGSVGALHERDRWWCLATDSESFRQQRAVNAQDNGGHGWRQFTSLPTEGSTTSDKALKLSELQRKVSASKFLRGNRGLPNWCDRVAIIGNSQHPLQAAFAWIMLGGPAKCLEVGDSSLT